MAFHKRLAKRAARTRDRIETTKAGQLFTSVGDLGAGFVSQQARDRNVARLDRASQRGTLGRVAAKVAPASGLFSSTQKEAAVNAALAVVPVPAGGLARPLARKADDISDALKLTRRSKPKSTPKTSGADPPTPKAKPKKGNDAPPKKPKGNGSDVPAPVRGGGRITTRTALIGGGLVGGTAFLLGQREGSDTVYVNPDGSPAPPGGGGSGGGGSGGGGGPDFQTGFLSNLTAGIGSMFDRFGAAIQDLANALGIPIGEGAGKAIAIGGTAILIAIALSKGLPALQQASKSTKAKPKAKTSGPKRGAGGRFLPKGGA